MLLLHGTVTSETTGRRKHVGSGLSSSYLSLNLAFQLYREAIRMAKSKENWLVTGAWDKINPIWRDRMLVILEDLAGVRGLRFAQLLDKTGRPISEQIGPGGPRQTVEVKFPLGRFARLYSSSFAAFDELGESPPTHMIEDYKDQLLFVGFIADMILIASFEPSTTRGAIVMRMTKRIRHLHSLQKSRERGALYT